MPIANCLGVDRLSTTSRSLPGDSSMVILLLSTTTLLVGFGHGYEASGQDGTDLEGSDGFVTSAAAPKATGWSDPVAK
jgi:hypothetical protein